MWICTLIILSVKSVTHVRPLFLIDKSMSSSEYVLNGTLIFATWKFADSIKAHLTVLV